jgi:hypothetical protein
VIPGTAFFAQDLTLYCLMVTVGRTPEHWIILNVLTAEDRSKNINFTQPRISGMRYFLQIDNGSSICCDSGFYGTWNQGFPGVALADIFRFYQRVVKLLHHGMV